MHAFACVDGVSVVMAICRYLYCKQGRICEQSWHSEPVCAGVPVLPLALPCFRRRSTRVRRVLCQSRLGAHVQQSEGFVTLWRHPGSPCTDFREGWPLPYTPRPDLCHLTGVAPLLNVCVWGGGGRSCVSLIERAAKAHLPVLKSGCCH